MGGAEVDDLLAGAHLPCGALQGAVQPEGSLLRRQVHEGIPHVAALQAVKHVIESSFLFLTANLN